MELLGNNLAAFKSDEITICSKTFIFETSIFAYILKLAIIPQPYLKQHFFLLSRVLYFLPFIFPDAFSDNVEIMSLLESAVVMFEAQQA